MGKTQCEKVIRYMTDKGSITQIDAFREFGIMRLASRIAELKQRGYDITSITEESKNRYGETIHYSRYMIRKANNDVQVGN